MKSLILITLLSFNLYSSEDIILERMLNIVGVENNTTKKGLSPGQIYINKIKNKNRDLIKQKHLLKEKTTKTSWLEKHKNLNNDFLISHQEKIKKTLLRWKQKKRIYNQNLKNYKKTTFEFQASKEKLKRYLANKMDAPKESQVILIPGAFKIQVKDQGKRSTCSAFAMARSLELLIYKENQSLSDLSEQYIYWISKPNCVDSPCSIKGSWPSNIPSKFYKIPAEKNCPYSKTFVKNNETQTPLDESCKKSKVTIGPIKRLDNLSDIDIALTNGHPVIIGSKLDANFYKNDGLVKWTNKIENLSNDLHSKGHAYLIVGKIKLSKKDRLTQGSHCYIVTNSWGEGWGLGGHSCITKKWMEKHHIPKALIVIDNFSYNI